MSPLPAPPVAPTVDDLQPWARRAFEEAYERRERRECSREDFAAAWLACLMSLQSFGSFKPRTED